MKWIFEVIANMMLETINDLMGWSISLVQNFDLAIGYSAQDKSISIINFIDPTKRPNQGLSEFDNLFSKAGSFTGPFLYTALLLVFLITIFKLFQVYATPLTQADPPLHTLSRSVLAGIGVFYSYSIFVFLEKIFNVIAYTRFKSIFDASKQEWVSLNGTGNGIFKMFGNNLIDPNAISGLDPASTKTSAVITQVDEYGFEQTVPTGDSGYSFALCLVFVIIGFALLMQFVRLVLEIYQRYVIIGILFYTCPLAFATLCSKSTKDIFAKWVQMVFSQFLLMLMNLFFVGVFISSIIQKCTIEDGGYIFANGQELLMTFLLWIVWLVIGQKADEMMRTLGLSAAQTGASLGTAIIGGAMIARTAFGIGGAALRNAGKGINSAAKFATGQTPGERIKGALYPHSHEGKEEAKIKENLEQERAIREASIKSVSEGKFTSAEDMQSKLTEAAPEVMGLGVEDSHGDVKPLSEAADFNKSLEATNAALAEGKRGTYLVDSEGKSLTKIGTDMSNAKKGDNGLQYTKSDAMIQAENKVAIENTRLNDPSTMDAYMNDDNKAYRSVVGPDKKLQTEVYNTDSSKWEQVFTKKDKSKKK